MDGNWQDSSVNGNHGTPYGDVTFSSNRKVGSQSGSFDGSGDYVTTVASNINPALDDFSVFAWVNLESTGSRNIIAMQNGSGTGRSLLYSLNTSNEIGTYLTGSTLFSGATINLDEWAHVGLSYNNSNHLLQFYINGEAKNSHTISTVSADGGFVIGANRIFTNLWAGQIDEIGVWNSVLNLSEVKTIYNRQKQKYAGHYDSQVVDLGAAGSWLDLTPITTLPFYKELVTQERENSSGYPAITGDLGDGLVGYWNLNGNANDRSTSGLNGTIQDDSAFITSEALFLEAVSLDGDSDYIEIINDPLLNTSEATYSAWVKLNSYSTRPHIMGKGNGSSGVFYIMVETSGEIKCYYDLNTPSWSSLSGGSITPTIGKWQHYTCSYNGSSVKLYLDGIEISSTNVSGSLNSSNTDNLQIGTIQGGVQSVDGLVDEAAVWNRGLSPMEVQQLYRRGANRIKYQIKSCVDSSCNCKSFAVTPLGTTNDCDGDGILNTTDSDDIYKATFTGVGGDGSTTYSELFNRSVANLHFDCSSNITDFNSNICVDDEIIISGDTHATSPIFTFSDMASSAPPSNNRYFQYRVLMEAEENSACAGKPCLPELKSLEIGPTQRYFGGTYVLRPKSPIYYSDIKEIHFSNSKNCSLTYQLSPDELTYYYHNGSSWISASSEDETESTSGANISSNITSFKSKVGSGLLYIKVFIASENFQSCSLEDISVVVSD